MSASARLALARGQHRTGNVVGAIETSSRLESVPDDALVELDSVGQAAWRSFLGLCRPAARLECERIVGRCQADPRRARALLHPVGEGVAFDSLVDFCATPRLEHIPASGSLVALSRDAVFHFDGDRGLIQRTAAGAHSEVLIERWNRWNYLATSFEVSPEGEFLILTHLVEEDRCVHQRVLTWPTGEILVERSGTRIVPAWERRELLVLAPAPPEAEPPRDQDWDDVSPRVGTVLALDGRSKHEVVLTPKIWAAAKWQGRRRYVGRERVLIAADGSARRTDPVPPARGLRTRHPNADAWVTEAREGMAARIVDFDGETILELPADAHPLAWLADGLVLLVERRSDAGTCAVEAWSGEALPRVANGLPGAPSVLDEDVDEEVWHPADPADPLAAGTIHPPLVPTDEDDPPF